MTLHRPRRPYSLAHARRKLQAAQAAYASWDARAPADWRDRADRHQALQKWGAEVSRWQALVEPRPLEHYRLPF